MARWTILLFSTAFLLFGQQSNGQTVDSITKKFLHGKWASCWGEKYFSNIEGIGYIDTTDCSNNQWDFEFFPDGTYKSRSDTTANSIDDSYVSTGKWSVKNNILTLYGSKMRTFSLTKISATRIEFPLTFFEKDGGQTTVYNHLRKLK